MAKAAPEVVDVIIVGAGISGVDAIYKLTTRCPQLKILCLERRQSWGGTWDIFRYPGSRSDTDMYTFGYDFKPWNKAHPIADRQEIVDYLGAVLDDHKLHSLIRYGQYIKLAAFDSATGKWNIDCESGNRFQAKFLFTCAGYYDANTYHQPVWGGEEKFRASGRELIHSMVWPEHKDYKGKTICVIGSGATAITVVPAMAQGGAKHVYMLQRTPGYFINQEQNAGHQAQITSDMDEQAVYKAKREAKGADPLPFKTNRTMNEQNLRILQHMRRLLDRDVIDDENFEKNFIPPYNVYDQRLCVTPDKFHFRMINERKVTVVTDHIECFDETGIKLKSGGRIDCDIVVSATGFELLKNFPFPYEVQVDGNTILTKDHCQYKDCMITGIPNLAFIQGYFIAAWTLKADLICSFICRLLNKMSEEKVHAVCPMHPPEGRFGRELVGAAGPNYKKRQEASPLFSTWTPWAMPGQYTPDKAVYEEEDVDDGVLHFFSSSPGADQYRQLGPFAIEPKPAMPEKVLLRARL